MQKYYIVSLLAIFYCTSAASASVSRDSIGVENLNGKKLIIHQVAQHDTYYSISRRYNIAPKEIMLFNDNKFLSIGAVIKVPTQRAFNEGPASPIKAGPGQTPVNQQESYTEHIVQKKENLNLLAKKYGTSIDEIKRINNLNSINLSIGQVLKMPVIASPDSIQTTPPVQTTVPQPQVKPELPQKKPDTPLNVRKQLPATTPNKPTPTPATTAENEELVVHTVASNETIYSIATSYKMTMDQLKAKNNLTSNSLRLGQKLLIKGQYGQKKFNPFESETDTLTSIKDPSLRYAASRYGLNQIDEKGTAISILDPDLDPNKMLVLHRTAPIGTVMKITNPMSNRSTFAKVVGKFTENESTKDVVLVMTKAVADALGALDKRFFCNLSYSGQENNEQ
ncbi:LysM peptidoglycan-binding domain-containing protein [Pedobacter sp.]|uniref:LysM peptidoglycan-binding domain-containing protein n=1 Tax=Pedobacter sp. TaxID=1411316 RepID=UPI003D7FCBD6